MNNILKILFVEDLQSDMELAVIELRKGGINFISKRVESYSELIKELNDFDPDVVISDYAMPLFDGMQALKASLDHNKNIPVIILTGSGRELIAVECMKAGATDYVIKEHIKRLPYAVKEALAKRKIREDANIADKAFRESEKRLRDIIFSMGEWVWEVDSNGVYTYSSKRGSELFAVSNEEILGKTPFDFMPPEEAKRMRAIFLEISAKKAQINDLENWNIDKNGRLMCLLTNGVPILDEAGNLKGYRGVDKDITFRKNAEDELRKSEKSYKSLFDNMLNGFAYCRMIFDAKGKPVDFIYLEVNETFAKLTGLENVKGKKVTEVIPGIQTKDDELFEIYGRVSLSGIPEHFEMYLNSLNDWYSISVYCPEKNYFVAVFDVVTERKQAEKELIHTKESLENLNQRLIDIREAERASISREIHDQLGQSLTALKIDLSWVLGKAGKDEAVRSKITGMIDLVTEIINNVQRISAELRPSILDDLGLSSALEWYCEEFVKRTGLVVEMELDNVQTENVIRNLAIFRIAQESFTNIIRHSGAEKVRIKLSKIKKQIVLYIHDDGIGIQPSQIESSASLGILGMFERIKQADGNMKISRHPEKGTVVEVSLPLR